jgi:capsular exopolysaccharide synthesis family protein
VPSKPQSSADAVPALVPRRDLPVSSQAPSAALEPFRNSAAGEGEQGINWRRYVRTVRRYKWWILGLMLLGGIGGKVATRFMPARYLAQATIWIQTNEAPRASAVRGPIGADQLISSSGTIPLVRSYVVLDQVVRDRRLFLRVAPKDRATFDSLTVQEQFQPGVYRLRVDGTGRTYRLTGFNDTELEHGAVGDSIGRPFGIVWAPSAARLRPGTDVAFGLAPVRDAAQILATALAIVVDPSGNFMRLALIGEDPVATAATVNAVAERYISVATDLKRAKLVEVTRLLQNQLTASRQNLQQAENALAAFRARTITLSPELSGPAAPTGSSASRGGRGDYFGLKVEADRLRRDREAITRTLAQRDSGSIEALAYIGAVQESADMKQALQELTNKRAELRALRYRYTDDHPTVRKLADDVAELERRTIPGLARSVLADLSGRERALAPEITAGGRELQAIPQLAVEEARLRRDADIAAALYTNVQARQSEAQLAEASNIADVRMLDAAVAPRLPMKPADSRLLILGLAFGLALGVVGAVVAERFDPRVRDADQVTGELGLRMLGMLPHVKNREAGPDDEQVAQLIEAMRSVRLNLLHAYGPSRPVIITVTSPGVGDGKSFVSTNLALACAQSGQRTLLIDGDSRRGNLHRGFQTARTPGLTDFLAERAPFEEIMRATKYRYLQFIPAGKRLRESPELIGSPAMGELIERVRPNFDVIVVDSPPLGAGVDPCTLGTLTGNMMLVLRVSTTDRDVTRTHLAMVGHLPIRLLGVVLNDVRPEGMYGYYGYYYLAGYGSEQEGLSEEQVAEPDGNGVALTRQSVSADSSTP